MIFLSTITYPHSGLCDQDLKEQRDGPKENDVGSIASGRSHVGASVRDARDIPSFVRVNSYIRG